MTDTVYRLRYAPVLLPLMSALGMGPRRSGVQVAGGELRVRMGWAFRARIPVAQVAQACAARMPMLGGWGVHGWDGRWLVNGSAAGIVRIDLDPPVPAHAVGVPIRLRTLWVSLAEPEDLLAALADARATAA